MTNKEIAKLIATNEISDQSQLLSLINKQGHEMTQSTLSRRLNKMGVVKQKGLYALPALIPSNISNLVLRITPAPPNILILQTPIGHAMALAHQLDFMSSNDPQSIDQDRNSSQYNAFPEILGTIAGDDTVLVVTREQKLKALKKKIEDLCFG